MLIVDEVSALHQDLLDLFEDTVGSFLRHLALMTLYLLLSYFVGLLEEVEHLYVGHLVWPVHIERSQDALIHILAIIFTLLKAL